MSQTAKATRQNRTITVDFQDETTYFQLLSNDKAFVEFVRAFVLSIGFQLKHKATCHGGGCLTRHSHDVRVRLGGLTIWRVQCTTCKAVFTGLPHVVLRYRRMSPDVARQALIATHGGLSLEWCAVICNISPMALRTRHGLEQTRDHHQRHRESESIRVQGPRTDQAQSRARQIGVCVANGTDPIYPPIRSSNRKGVISTSWKKLKSGCRGLTRTFRSTP